MESEEIARAWFRDVVTVCDLPARDKLDVAKDPVAMQVDTNGDLLVSRAGRPTQRVYRETVKTTVSVAALAAVLVDKPTAAQPSAPVAEIVAAVSRIEAAPQPPDEREDPLPEPPPPPREIPVSELKRDIEASGEADFSPEEMKALKARGRSARKR